MGEFVQEAAVIIGCVVAGGIVLGGIVGGWAALIVLMTGRRP